jgi:hypothetical protein
VTKYLVAYCFFTTFLVFQAIKTEIRMNEKFKAIQQAVENHSPTTETQTLINKIKKELNEDF